MILKERKEKFNEIHHIVSLGDTDYYFGIYNVLFGQRIRAGNYNDNYSVNLDWCCGDDPVLLATTYAILYRYFERWDGEGNPFKNLPTCSMIKPFHHDKDFLDKVGEVIPEFKEIKYVELDNTI